MASIGKETIGAVILNCPVCNEEMPPVKLEIESLSMGKLDVRVKLAPVFDGPWYEQARVEHGECLGSHE